MAYPVVPVPITLDLTNSSIGGSAYNATTGVLTAGGNGTYAFSLFNPASAKSALIYSVRLFNQSGGVVTLKTTTTDPAFSGGNAFFSLLNNPQASTGNLCTGTYTTVAGVPSGGTAWGVEGVPTNQLAQELMTSGTVLVLPSGAANGLMLYTFVSSAQTWGVTVRYVQY